jgi:hypothetical protein
MGSKNRAALIARRFYLGCLCPGCGQRGSVDLRRVNRDPRRLARKPDPNAVLRAMLTEPALCQTYGCIAQAALVQPPPFVRYWCNN